MKSLLKLISLISVFGIAALNAAPANEKCPISGKAIDPDATGKYTAVLAFCCEKCQGAFKKNPADKKFAAALAAAAGKTVNSACPVSGKEIDADCTSVHNGNTIAFCCGKCKKNFDADPAKFAAKVKADAPANEKCPISGKSVDASTAVAHTQEVGLCCKKCLAKFNKDPGAVVNK